ncbi:MAG TPA: hypothetical protein VLN49_21925 [Gemmatimonadaceae bacterium]|nr:hypothetical protein [Gemmatimonadaceae bacterium]
MHDPHAKLRDEIFHQVLDGPGESDPAARREAAADSDVASDLRTLVGKIHQHAYTVTDDDVASLQAVHGDDKMFEIIVAAALGASRQRLAAGLAALEEA